MQIPCPWCGSRPLDEFEYGGDATKKRPEGKKQENMEAWVDYAFLHDNVAGRHKEYWQHVGGCRCWLIVTRDTRTHEIIKSEFAVPQLRSNQR
ncbi:MAG: sarcosine oxidase subunit delta [Hyphomicrobiaceae bacterium]|nr:sarcosine oxidase subunit delta [Hyphomicrobiaceae bacterium]